MHAVPTVCPFCGVGCGMVLGVEGGRVTDVRPGRAIPSRAASSAPRAGTRTSSCATPERLTTPLVRRGGRLEPATWDEALDASRPTRCEARAEDGGPDAVGVIASARATNEDAYAAMKFARAVLGTNNVDHCARVCHAPSVAGLRRTLGSGAMTNSIADIDRADCCSWSGSDTTENHAIIGARMLEAQRRGVPLIVIDPRRTRLARGRRPAPPAPARHRHPARERDDPRDLRARLGGRAPISRRAASTSTRCGRRSRRSRRSAAARDDRRAGGRRSSTRRGSTRPRRARSSSTVSASRSTSAAPRT